jgi:hypothetical protein
MRIAIATALALVAGCNSILGNGDFVGPNGSVDPPGDAGPDACSGIGCMVVDCAGQGKPPTSVSGTVFSPDGTLPLYNAVVYVPTAPLAQIIDGAASPACISGEPVVYTRTNAEGRFRLENIPVVAELPVVIQLGKWRRELKVTTVEACSERRLPALATRLPRSSSEGHVPRIAISAGTADALECLPRRLGLPDSELTSSRSTGRVHLYAGPGAVASVTGGPAMESADLLYGRMLDYDQVLLGCDGSLVTRSSTSQTRLRQYVDAGGWLWMSHFQYNWLAAPSPFPAFATFVPAGQTSPSIASPALFDATKPTGEVFVDWMEIVGGTSQPEQMTISNTRSICSAVDSTMVERFIYLDPEATGLNAVQLFAWPTAAGGRLLYSDIHLHGALASSFMFPQECETGPLAPEGKAIAFHLFNQSTCIP